MHTAAEHVFQSRLDRIARPIARHWGVWFPVRVADQDDIVGGFTDLREIWIHRNAMLLDDRQLHVLLAHEWMHGVAMPRSRERDRWFRDRVAGMLGLPVGGVKPALALAMELLVDRHNMEVPAWGEAYAEHGYTLVELAWQEQGRVAAGVEGLVTALRLLVFDRGFPAALEMHRETAQAGLDALFARGFPGRPPRKIGDDAYVERMAAFAAVMVPCLGPGAAEAVARTGRLEALVSELLHARWKRQRRSRASDCSPQGKPTPAETESDFDHSLMRRVSQVLRWQRKAYPATDRWIEGHPLDQLDLKRSYRQHCRLIPGLTTRRRRPGRRPALRLGSECDRRVLVVDDSNSMEGKPARLARSLAEGLNRFSAEAQIETGLLVFASDVIAEIEPGYRNAEIRSILAGLQGRSGGTRIEPAVQALMRAHRIQPISHMVIISDAKARDWVSALRPLLGEGSGIQVTLLLVNKEVPEPLRQAVARRFSSQVRLLQVDPNEKENTWLREIGW